MGVSTLLSTLLFCAVQLGADAYTNCGIRYCSQGCCGYNTCCYGYSSGVSNGYYIGSSIGGLVFFGIMIAVCVCCMRRRRAYNQQYIRRGQPGVMVVNAATGQPMPMNQQVNNGSYPGYPSYPPYPAYPAQHVAQPVAPPPYNEQTFGTGNVNVGFVGNPYDGNANISGETNVQNATGVTAAAQPNAPPPSYSEITKEKY